MGTTIRISERTRERLERRKREGESFDDLLRRLAQESDSMNPGVWSAEQADVARERLRASREGFERDRWRFSMTRYSFLRYCPTSYPC